MAVALPVLVACLFAATFYLLMSEHIVRILIGIVLFSNGVNLLIFAAGRVSSEVPPLIPAGAEVSSAAMANPLPQALILTAIVISFSIFAFLLVLTFRAYQDLETDEVREMRLAEPEDQGPPPLGY